MEEVRGYKAFNKDATNRYGMLFLQGFSYRVKGKVAFGNHGNGFHMCTTLADVFRYFDASSDNFLVAEVVGFGEKVIYHDEFYGYYDMYVVEGIKIERFMTRDEIIDKMLVSCSWDVQKFLATFTLTDAERIRFLRVFNSNSELLKAVLYHQYGCRDVYQQRNNENLMRLVFKNGQNNS